MTLPFATRRDKFPIDKSYQLLHKWTNESLENIKIEVHSVLYPLFVYAYLKCIVCSNTEMAKKLLELAKLDHNIDEFLNINDPQHLQESGLYTKWMDSKYTVQLSRFAFELLINFLDEHSMITFLVILNSNINVTILDSKKIKSTASANSSNSKVLLGATELHEDMPLIMKQKLKDDELQSIWDKKQKHSEMATDKPPYNRVPMPAPTYLDVQNELIDLNDLKHRIQVNNRFLPSICCYTLHNTNNKTSTIKLNKSITILGAGFRSSTIQLWSLNDAKLRSLVNDPNPSATELDQILDQGSTTRELIGHSGPVYDIEFSRDERFMMSSSQDSSIRLWSLLNYTNMAVYQGHQYPVWDIDMGNQMTYFVSASMDGTCRLWSTDRVVPLRMFVGHLSDVDCVKLHDNANYVLSGSSDRTCRLWDSCTGKSVRLFTGHDAPINVIQYSPDGRVMACASQSTIYIWDIAECKLLGKCVGHEDLITSLAFDKLGNLLTSGGLDGSVCIWDIMNSSELMVPLKICYTKATPIFDLMFTERNLLMALGAFSPDLLKFEK
eukprot:NODE_10_length_47437_cov_0.363429.p7 type:complete len:552 gc:universal NODE_10_length_47437_cov_0.363429:41566-39911(-)